MDSFELDISFLPRHDQGSRGTCMAFAVTSLLEYYFHDGIRLSPQYLYACCKHEEQDDGKGTTLETAFQMVVEHGFCKEADWPYNNYDITANHEGDAVENEMQIKSNRLKELDKLANVSCWEIRERFHEFYTPSSVEECKAALRGDGGRRPMPVVIGCMVFPSFTEKAEQDGWIHLPIPGEEKYNSGHAMLVTGYKDTPDPNFPSEGYFWALNSWGPSIHDDPMHKGMVKIPYEYYADFALEAGTIREDLSSQDAKTQESVQIPQHTGEEMSMTETPINIPTEKTNSATSPIVLSDAFFASLENNLKQKEPIFPLPYDLFYEQKPWFSSKVQFGKTQDETTRFKGFVHENATSSHAPQGNVKVFPLCKDGTFRIIAATLSHDDGSLINTSDITILHDFISRRLTASRTVSHDVIVIAANVFNDDCQPVLSPPIVLCMPTAYNLWDFRFPQAVFSTETINFFLHALPGSPNAYADRLSDLINHWPKTTYCTKDALRQKLALHPSIPDGFLIHWLDVLFEHAAQSKNKNDWYAKDDRGYIYPPRAELPEGHGAKRVKRFS